MRVSDNSSGIADENASSFCGRLSHSIGYRPGIDDLRVVAVMAVLAYLPSSRAGRFRRRRHLPRYFRIFEQRDHLSTGFGEAVPRRF
jgi:hypothetical protein